MSGMALYLACNQVSGNYTACLSIHKHRIKDIPTMVKRNIACSNLAA